MIAPVRSLFVLALAVLLGGCSSHFVNGKLDRFDKNAGYRYGKLSGDANSDDLFVILALSGGGTRAAAFSFGVMEGLRDAVYISPGGPRQFLRDVDVISSVSGGSFTAAYYALFPEKFFAKFPSVFLERNVEGDLIGLALWPPNWFRLAASDFDRINLAAEYYNETIFEHKTFGELIAKARKPYVILNATDMTLGRRFEFTQDQFDLLCSDLSTVKIATAVAASSAFPGLLSPLTLKNFARKGCNYERPQWLTDSARIFSLRNGKNGVGSLIPGAFTTMEDNLVYASCKRWFCALLTLLVGQYLQPSRYSKTFCVSDNVAGRVDWIRNCLLPNHVF